MFSKNKTARIGTVCFVVFCLCVLLAGSAIAKKPDNPGKPKPDDPPPIQEDAGTLSLAGINIVTVQPNGDGSLHVWSGEGANWEYINKESSWTLPDVHHYSVAIGDLDGNGLNEIIVPAACGLPEGSGYPYGIFINAYEEEAYYTDGISDVYWTTFYSRDDNDYYDYVKENTHLTNQILVANLDNEPGDEIALITDEHIAIFDYLPGTSDPRWQGNGTIVKIADISLVDIKPDYSGGGTDAVAVGNVVGGPSPDIVVTITSAENAVLQGYLVIFEDPFAPDPDTSELNLLDNYESYIGFPTWGYNPDGLQLSNMDDEGYFTKIWTGGSTRDETTEPYWRGNKVKFRTVIGYDAYLSLWENSDGPWSETKLVEIQKGADSNSWFKIATGEIYGPADGDELVIGEGSDITVFNSSDLISEYELQGKALSYSELSDLESAITYSLEPGAVLNNIAVYDSKIILGGATTGISPSLYLGVIDPDDETYPIWELRNGPGREAWDFAVIAPEQ